MAAIQKPAAAVEMFCVDRGKKNTSYLILASSCGDHAHTHGAENRSIIGDDYRLYLCAWQYVSRTFAVIIVIILQKLIVRGVLEK